MPPRRKGYGRGPWVFRGQAHYQFHLVKSSVARQYVPDDMPLVEAFGHTLGGFYYANYSDSPVGRMDELVVLSGLVWNAPTSCAWASHVFVDSREAVTHGRRVFGLPSHKTAFTKSKGSIERVELNEGGNPILELKGTGKKMKKEEEEQRKRSGGPKIKFQLPSFSGRTRHNPDLLKYDLDMSARIQPCKPFDVVPKRQTSSPKQQHSRNSSRKADAESSSLSAHVNSILSGKKLFSFKFGDMLMRVQHPQVVPAKASSSLSDKKKGTKANKQEKPRRKLWGNVVSSQ